MFHSPMAAIEIHTNSSSLWVSMVREELQDNITRTNKYKKTKD